MNSENYYLMNSEEISSDQEGDQEDESGGTGSKRSYNCTFCKRGFTNAQALGGHMNIHRKDRAKTKHKQQQLINMPTSTSSNYRFATNDESMPFPFLFHEPAPPNPTIRNQNLHSAPAPAPSAFPHDSRSMNQEHGGPNLSLQIGPTTHHVDNTMINQIRNNENEVDLELRLGYDP